MDQQVKSSFVNCYKCRLSKDPTEFKMSLNDLSEIFCWTESWFFSRLKQNQTHFNQTKLRCITVSKLLWKEIWDIKLLARIEQRLNWIKVRAFKVNTRYKNRQVILKFQMTRISNIHSVCPQLIYRITKLVSSNQVYLILRGKVCECHGRTVYL